MVTPSPPDTALLDLALSVRREARRTSDDTAARILVESIQLFATHGYAGTSMREIGAAVGIQAASIYAHFESKQQILAEALGEVLYQFHSFIVDATEAGLKPRDQLERVVKQHVRWQFRFPQVARSWDVLWEIEGVAGNLDPRKRAEISARRECYHALVVALAAALRPSDRRPRVRAEAILSLCDRAAVWGTAIDLEAVDAETAADVGWELASAILA